MELLSLVSVSSTSQILHHHHLSLEVANLNQSSLLTLKETTVKLIQLQTVQASLPSLRMRTIYSSDGRLSSLNNPLEVVSLVLALSQSTPRAGMNTGILLPLTLTLILMIQGQGQTQMQTQIAAQMIKKPHLRVALELLKKMTMMKWRSGSLL